MKTLRLDIVLSVYLRVPRFNFFLMFDFFLFAQKITFETLIPKIVS
jgi:hypothetical protein